jgi:proline iminopeptidase
MRSLRVPADDGALLHVGVTGEGPDVVVLSGGPGCVHLSLAASGPAN